MLQTLDQSDNTNERMSLTQAARWTGKPKAYLRELVESGRLAVYLVPENGEIKQRVTHAALVEAGLIAKAPADPERDLGELIALVREQSTRIGALEEQRFQLGAQLGAAFERIVTLEEQVQALPNLQSDLESEIDLDVILSEPEIVVAGNGQQGGALSIRSAATRFSELGLHGSSALGSLAARQSIRLFARARRRSRGA